MQQNHFQNAVTVITGAGGTICSKLALDLAAEGAMVILVGRSMEKLLVTKEKIDAIGGKCDAFSCDVTDRAAVDALAAQVKALYGPCRYLLNGAGGNDRRAMPTIPAFDPRELTEERPEELRGLYNVDMDAFEQVLRTNTMGTVYPTLAFARQMAEAGGGSILNFASMNSYCPLTRCFAYAMSKAAIVNLTQSLAAYFAPAHIRVNAIAPGFVVNERSRHYLGTVEEGLTARGQKVIAHTPMGRFGEAGEMTGAVKWLLDEQAAGFVTGVTIPVDGGFLTLGGV